MSDENVELVRRAWEASAAADWPTVLSTLDPDAEIRDFDVPDSQPTRGHDGFLEWIGHRIANGRIVYMAYFNDQERALEAIGSGQQAHD